MKDDVEHPEIGEMYICKTNFSRTFAFESVVIFLAVNTDLTVRLTSGYAKLLTSSGEILHVNRAFVHCNLKKFK